MKYFVSLFGLVKLGDAADCHNAGDYVVELTLEDHIVCRIQLLKSYLIKVEICQPVIDY